MFSFFKRNKVDKLSKLTQPHSDPSDSGPTVIDVYKMTLEERKEWRLQMLKMTVKETLRTMEILSGMYRYRAMSLDDRGHYYAVMIETTKLFQLNKHSTFDLALIEKRLQEHAFSNYGIVVDAVYWKANEHINTFKRVTDVPELPQPPYAPRPRTQPQLEEYKVDALHRGFSDTLPMTQQQLPAQSHKYEPPTDDEARAFRAAIAKAGVMSSHYQPVLYVGDKEYSTDLAPLGPM
jgi:hypothetical protein